MSHSTNPLSVCMITTGFPVIAGDNSGIFIKKLVDRFGEEIKLKILVPSHKKKFVVPSDSYKIIRVKYFFRRWENLFYSKRGLPQEIKRNPFILWQLPFFIIAMIFTAIVHAKDVDILHAQWLPTGLFGILPKLIWGKPLIVSVRGSDMTRFNTNFIDKQLAKVVFKFCDSVIVVSKSIESQLNKHFPNVNIVYIPNGIDKIESNNIRNNPKNELFEILYVGNLVQEKGILDLMQVFEELISTNYKARLTLIGNGDLKNTIEAWSADKSGKVFLKGTIPHEEVINFMRISDVLVLPSYGEGRPNVVVEAMANHLPVIGTTIDGIMELITNKESGLLFEPGDKKTLFELLRDCLVGTYPLNQFSEKAYEWIQNNSYSWDRAAKSHVDLYKSVLSKNILKY